MSDTIRQHESNVRGYCRLFPAVFDIARGSELWDAEGKRFIDFFCGAGSLNYGHNNPLSKAALLEYIERDAIQHSLDITTTAKIGFIEAFQSIILKPRDLNYKLQFTGPTGTNAVEAALKLARKSTSRGHVVAFTHAYHGHTLGSLALTANRYYHDEHYGARNNVSHLPYDGFAPGLDSAALLQQMLEDPSSGLPLPAAVILETVQGEGGVNVASDTWLRRIAEICSKHNIVLIVDDIQVGNGRTGTFFSFENAGIKPDLVCLSKSLGGGLPMSLLLMKPEFDQWKPGEHTATFRGNNLAFVAARALLEYWKDAKLSQHIDLLRQHILARLAQMTETFPEHNLQLRGRGLIQGVDVQDGQTARAIVDACFERGLLIESSGAHDEVLKVMPALTTPLGVLIEGLDILEASMRAVLLPEARACQPASAVFPVLETNVADFRIASEA
jgi:diaminobutyrate-2-oxoglutarate transaminase